MYKTNFFLLIFYPLRNLARRANVTFALGLNCMEKTRELVSRSRGSPWSTAIERRRAIRYPLQVPAFFSWEDEEGIVRHGEGQTRNISEKGALVDAAILPPIGSSVDLQYSLPALVDAERNMHVQCKGQTIRLEGTEHGEQSSSFAITSREVVWRYENGDTFSQSEKQPN